MNFKRILKKFYQELKKAMMVELSYFQFQNTPDIFNLEKIKQITLKEKVKHEIKAVD